MRHNPQDKVRELTKKFLQNMGYDISKEIYPQFMDKHEMDMKPRERGRPKKNIQK